MRMANKAVMALGIALVVVLAGVAAWYFLYEGTVSVYVKDAVGPWDHVYVTFSAVQIHESGKDNASWTTIASTKQTVDLATLTNLSKLLGSAKLNPGHYEQIRLTVDNVTGVLTGTAQPIDITVVNGTAKVVGQFTVNSGATTTVTLDVNLATSIHGNATSGYFFTPVIATTVG